MAENSSIEWTRHTFNIAWGCTKVSPGCANCYADTLSHRYGFDVWGSGKERRTFGEKHWNEPLAWNRKAAAAGERHRVFCSSMCDVFEDHPTIDAEREKLWPLIRATPDLDWLLLTKRPERLKASLPYPFVGYPNVWIGVSVEDQQRADERIPHLLRCPAAARFLSVEPLLGAVDLSRWLTCTAEKPYYPARPAWVIVGGESGPGARPMHLAWVRSLLGQCRAAGVPTFIKQLGPAPQDWYAGDEFLPAFHDGPPLPSERLRDRKGGDMDEWPADLRVRQLPEAAR